MHNELFITNKDINNIKIALLSDIHYYPEFNTKIFTLLIKQIKKNKPNYICITGDILDKTNITNIDALIAFLKELANITTTLIVLGNHDIKYGEYKHWIHSPNNLFINEIQKINNLYLLEDQIYIDDNNNIAFYGFNLSYNYYEVEDEKYEVFVEEVNKLTKTFPNNTYNITLLHTPYNIYRFIANNPLHPLSKTDLILNGHMHNGCLPFTISYVLNKVFKSNRGIVSPTRKLFPKYSHGRIKDIKDGYIMEGITKFSKSTKKFHKFDIFYKKRIEIITIKKQP